MHRRGKALCVEAILPSMIVRPISCVDRFNADWQLVYHYADAAAPLLPAGTILHVIGWHDNSAGNPNNPDPRNWAGDGGRTIDEMSFAWVSYYTLSDEEYCSRERRGRAMKRTPPVAGGAAALALVVRRGCGPKRCRLPDSVRHRPERRARLRGLVSRTRTAASRWSSAT